MSFNRRRNIFTIGDFQLPQQPTKEQFHRRQNCDLFERDPFKIQSYNFHYADRPVFNLPNLVNRVNNTPPKHFETYFYNYDFTHNRNDKENSSSNKFHEFRRRKFLQTNQHTSSNLPQWSGCRKCERNQRQELPAPTVTKIPTYNSPTTKSSTSLRNGYNRECMQRLRSIPITSSQNSRCIQQENRQQIIDKRSKIGSSHSLVGLTRSSSGGRLHTEIGSGSTSNLMEKIKRDLSTPRMSTSEHNKRQERVRYRESVENFVTASLERKNSTCSGCQININIKGLSESQLPENVTIKIETDSSNNFTTGGGSVNVCETRKQYSNMKACNQVLNKSVPGNLSSKLNTKTGPYMKRNIETSTSSDTFVIDKRLSKLSIKDNIKKMHSSNTRPIVRIQEPFKTSLSALELKPGFVNIIQSRNFSKDRMPSMVTWQLESNIPSGSKNNDTNVQSLRLRRLNAALNSGLNNMRSIKSHPECPISPYDRKALNSVQLKPLLNRNLHSSTHSLHANTENRNLDLRSSIKTRNSDTQLKGMTAGLYQSRQNLSTSPFNVNINVYADKLKLLRV